MDTFITILYPVVLSCSSFFFLSKFQYYKKLIAIEKLILGMGTSISVFIILLSWFSVISNSGFIVFSKILFYLGLMLVVLFARKLWREKYNFEKLQFNILEKGVLILILAVLIKIFFIYAIRPVIDSDVIVSYLPFARSMVLEGHAPERDLFTLNPMTIPPVGGPALFALFYSVADSVATEGFRFLTLPFLLGMALVTYALSRKLLNRKLALTVVLVFLSLPIIDDILNGWVLYPDVIFSFLGLIVFYFATFKLKDLQGKGGYFLSILLGLILAASLLLKTQGLLLIYLILALLFFFYRIRNFPLYFLSLVLFTIPFLLGFVDISGFNNFGYMKPNMPMTLIRLVFLLALGFVFAKTTKKYSLKRLLPFVIIFGFSLLGFLWMGRNIYYYGHPLSPFNTDLNMARSSLYKNLNIDAGILGKERQVFPEVAFLSLPIFGTLVLLPKLFGVVASILSRKNRNSMIFMLWLLSWYLIVIQTLGGTNARYLLMCMPVLSFLIVLGLTKIARILIKGRIRVEGFVYFASALTLLILLSQSIFLSWTIGAKTFSQAQLRKIVYDKSSILPTIEKINIGNLDLPAAFVSKIVGISRLLNLREGLYGHKEIYLLLLVGLIVSATLLLLAFLLTKLIKREKILLFTSIVALVFMVPYLIVVLMTSSGEISQFSKKHEEQVFNYWGLSTQIAPYFDNGVSNKSIILVFGPQSGLSYRSNMRVYNMNYGFAFKEIMPILDVTNEEHIFDFFKERNIDYIVVFTGQDPTGFLKRYKENSHIFDTIEDERFFVKVVEADEENLWTLYKRQNLNNKS